MPELVDLPERPFVCPWCGARFVLRFVLRSVLDVHWRMNPECSANRNVSNQTQTRYDLVDPVVPGLRLVDREDRDA